MQSSFTFHDFFEVMCSIIRTCSLLYTNIDYYRLIICQSSQECRLQRIQQSIIGRMGACTSTRGMLTLVNGLQTLYQGENVPINVFKIMLRMFN